MELKASTWHKYCGFGIVILFPFVAVFFAVTDSPNLVRLQYVAITLFSLFGASGALVAVLLKAGCLTMVYSQRDLDQWLYREEYDMIERIIGSKSVAIRDDTSDE